MTTKTETIVQDYHYVLDSGFGTLEAESFAAACAQLDAMVPDQCIEDGGWGYVRDCDSGKVYYAGWGQTGR